VVVDGILTEDGCHVKNCHPEEARRRIRMTHLGPQDDTHAVFELWDAELGLSLGRFDTEAEALAAVRKLCEQSHGSRAPLGLIDVDARSVVATGDGLVERALLSRV
jgi:hypothetical protein